MIDERLRKQLEFVLEIDKIKHITRQNYLADGSRHENDAEHSWHLAIMAFLLAEHCDEKIDVSRVIKMVLVHDLVEIYAGDTYCYDEKAAEDKCEREKLAADKLFRLLPEDQEKVFRGLWEEFEAMDTPEARFSAALDRIQPLLLNYNSHGKSWKEHGIAADQVRKRNEKISMSSAALWKVVQEIIKNGEEKGYLKPGQPQS